MLRKMAFSIDDPMMDMKISELGELLGTLQRQLKDTDRSLLIVLSGWEATGKGLILNDLVREIDPRYFHLSQFKDATETVLVFYKLTSGNGKVQELVGARIRVTGQFFRQRKL